MGCQRKPQTFALRRNSTRPPMVLPAVCLSGGNSTGPLSFSPSRTAGNFSTKKVEKKASLGGGCCQVPLEDHQALHEDPSVLLKQARRAKVLRENCDSLANKSLKKTRPHPPHPSCAWCAATCWSCEKKTLAFSEDDPVFPRWKLSKPPQSRTNTPQAKPSLLALEPRQSSLARQGPQAFATFPTLP